MCFQFIFKRARSELRCCLGGHWSKLRRQKFLEAERIEGAVESHAPFVFCHQKKAGKVLRFTAVNLCTMSMVTMTTTTTTTTMMMNDDDARMTRAAAIYRHPIIVAQQRVLVARTAMVIVKLCRPIKNINCTSSNAKGDMKALPALAGDKFHLRMPSVSASMLQQHTAASQTIPWTPIFRLSVRTTWRWPCTWRHESQLHTPANPQQHLLHHFSSNLILQRT